METLLQYAKSLNCSDEIINWLNTTAFKYVKSEKISSSELEHIIDWLNSSDSPKRLKKMSIKDASRLSIKWMNKNKEKGKDIKDSEEDINIFLSFKDGSKIVKLLTKKSLEREGHLMSHCLGGYSIRDDFDVYSLRDTKNNPHATFEVSKSNNDILQIKGKGNGAIHPKYIHKVLDFLKEVGLKIRPSEMVNLGYYYIPKEHINFIKNKIKKDEKIISLNNEFYLI